VHAERAGVTPDLRLGHRAGEHDVHPGIGKRGRNRFLIAVGEPVYVPKGLDAAGLTRIQLDMERRLRTVFEEANSALG